MKNDKITVLIILQLILLSGFIIIELHYGHAGIVKGMILTTLLVISVSLLLSRTRFTKRLKQIDVELKRAVDGNLRTRLFANEEHLLNEVIFSINLLIEKLEQVQVETIKTEEARKSLLSSISHDIRTPLTSIIGYVDALKDEIASSEEEKEEYLAIISKKSNGLKELIDQLFNLAKLDADEVPITMESLDIAELVRESLIEFLPDIKKYQLELQIQIPENRCMIRADRLSVSRVIGNIVNNALLYGKDGKVLGVGITETKKEYQLHIWDHGPGIPKKDLENVFERMYRTDQSRNSRSGGSGLGLAISKVLMEKQEGRIGVESVPWEKTTFTMSFPKLTQ